jgi:hypothetical protein
MADDKDDKKVLGTGARESRPETDGEKKSDKKKKSDG